MKKRYKILPPIKPSRAIIALYQAILKQFIRDMIKDVNKNVIPAVKQTLEYVQEVVDANKIDQLKREIARLKEKYIKRYGLLAQKLPENVIKKIQKDVGRRITNILAGEYAVKFKLTKEQQIIAKLATVENVNLIKSIPQEFFKRLENDIYQSVSAGRDFPKLIKKIKNGYGVSERKSAMLAFDQTNKITERIDRETKKELGITKAIWRHSSIPKEPRHSHVSADGKKYDIRKGCYISGEWIQPGEKINCGCFSQAIIEY